MIATNSHKKENNTYSDTTIRHRRKIQKKNKTEMHSINSTSDNEFGTEIIEMKNKTGTTNIEDDSSIGSDFEIVDSTGLTEIELLDNEEEDSLIPNISIDLTKTTESSFFIALQVFFPFFAAGLGTVAAGLLLDHVQVFQFKTKNFFYLVLFYK